MTRDPDEVTVVDHRANRDLYGWQPFVFAQLPKVSRADARAMDNVQHLVSAGGEAALDAVRARLTAAFDLRVNVSVARIHVASSDEVRGHRSLPSFVAAISCGAQAAPVFVEVDLALAHALVDALLGGPAEPAPFRPLTEIEEGVIAFAVLEALRGLASAMDRSWSPLRLEGVLRGRDEILVDLEGESRAALVQLECEVASRIGAVRIVLPGSVLEFSSQAPRGRVRVDGRRNPFALIRTSLRAEVGRVELSAADLAGLAAGDVVVIGGVSVRSDRREGGRAELRVGTGQSGWMDAGVALDGAGYAAAITAFHFEAPAPLSADVPEEVNMDDSRSEGTELLRDIPLQIAVELARVPITADEVAQLHVGQVIDLRRGPGEPVALSVNGKVIAHGQLVELEGQLGVRILALA